MNKKNLFEIDLNKSSKACDPCALECEKINKKINNRKLSDIKHQEIDRLISVFSNKD